MQFRKMIMEAKEQFSTKLDYSQGIASSVHRGFYYGLGGEMDFSLPELFDLISEVIGKVIQAKKKYDKRGNGNVLEIVEYKAELERAFKNKKDRETVDSIEFGFEMPENTWNLAITNFQTGESVLVEDAGEFSGEVIKRIILAIIRLYDRTGNVEKYVEEIEKTVDKDLELMFREG